MSLLSKPFIYSDVKWFFTDVEVKKQLGEIGKRLFYQSDEQIPQGDIYHVLHLEGYALESKNKWKKFSMDINRYVPGHNKEIEPSAESCLHVMSGKILYTIETNESKVNSMDMYDTAIEFNHRGIIPFTVYASVIGLILAQW